MAPFFFLAILSYTFCIFSMDKNPIENILILCIKNKLIDHQNNLANQNETLPEPNNVIEWITIAQLVCCTQKECNIIFRQLIINTKKQLAERITHFFAIHPSENIQAIYSQHNDKLARALGTFLTHKNSQEGLKKVLKKKFFALLEEPADEQKKDTKPIKNLILNFLPTILISNIAPQVATKQTQQNTKSLFVENFFAGMVQYSKNKYAQISLNPKELQQYRKYESYNTLSNIKIYFTTGHFNSSEYATMHIYER
ncbi:hypothetical protein EKK58_02405 [Candidatus Dependentiae bacterium]|nr:MAG: hypothetical protein EKK58_02405 [Candidatus Dependentiae bacterium]